MVCFSSLVISLIILSIPLLHGAVPPAPLLLLLLLPVVGASPALGEEAEVCVEVLLVLLWPHDGPLLSPPLTAALL
jgi:hypothetical protein